MASLQEKLKIYGIEDFEAQATAWTAEYIAELIHPEPPVSAPAGPVSMQMAVDAWWKLSTALDSCLAEESRPHVLLAENLQGKTQDRLTSAILQFREWQRNTAENAEQMRRSIKSLMDAWIQMKLDVLTPAQIRANRTKCQELATMDFYGEQKPRIEKLENEYFIMKLTNRNALTKYYKVAREVDTEMQSFRKLPIEDFYAFNFDAQKALNTDNLRYPPLAGDNQKQSPISRRIEQLRLMNRTWLAARADKELAKQQAALAETQRIADERRLALEEVTRVATPPVAIPPVVVPPAAVTPGEPAKAGGCVIS